MSRDSSQLVRRSYTGVLRRPLTFLVVLILSACAGPGSNQSSASSSGSVSTKLGSGPITINAYFETGFPVPKALADEFTKQYPNVTFNIREDQFSALMDSSPRVLAGDNAPDIIRLPSLVDLVKDGLLKNLDPYYQAYGWEKFSAAQLSQMRVAPGGRPRGTGSLYGLGITYTVTGVFYNKTLARRIGMTSPPATVDEFEATLAKAKAAGILPIMQFNKGTAGIAFPLQALMNSYYGDPTQINNWIFQKPGATIDTPAALKAAQHIQQWAKAGYFESDANATDYFTMNGRFQKGEGLFMFNGDWESANLDKAMAGNVGFFLFPPVSAGGKHVAMSAPGTYGIGAKAKHADAAAYFLNWIHTNPKAREICVNVGGATPGGPTNLPVPSAAAGTVTAETLQASQTLARENGATDFIANATGAIFAESETPEIQKLIAGQETPENLIKAVQAEYVKEVGA